MSGCDRGITYPPDSAARHPERNVTLVQGSNFTSLVQIPLASTRHDGKRKHVLPGPKATSVVRLEVRMEGEGETTCVS